MEVDVPISSTLSYSLPGKSILYLAVSSNVVTGKIILQTYFNILNSFVAFCAFLIVPSV